MEKLLNQIKSKSIAVVYAFQKEPAKGSKHYDFWSMDVLGDWVKAIEEVSCIPYILDVRTFGYKALNNTLPPIDFVLNLNAGTFDLSTLGLVPSICGFLSIPCIPCETIQAVAGEHKELSTLVADAMKINTPKKINSDDPSGIFRPLNLGSSIGVSRGFNVKKEGIYQEFIKGFDMTTPILYNPISKRLEVLPSISYVSADDSIEWFLGEKEKELHKGYKKTPVRIDSATEKLYLELVKTYGVKTFCRIDARVKCESIDERNEIINNGEIPHERVFFLEINAMPTIVEKINFCNSIESVTMGTNFYECFSQYNRLIRNSSTVGFILFCSMMSLKPYSHAL
ncbi:MAG: hypothetical protein JXR05_17375 [Flavobacteriaceae bacterium]